MTACMGDPNFPNPIIEIFMSIYSCLTIGMRHPVPKAREVTLSTGAACFLLNSAIRTSRSTRRTVS